MKATGKKSPNQESLDTMKATATKKFIFETIFQISRSKMLRLVPLLALASASPAASASSSLLACKYNYMMMMMMMI